MNIYLQYAWEYLINLLETGTFCYFINVTLTPKKIPYQPFVHTLFFLGRFILICICNTISLTPPVTMFVVSIYACLFVSMLYKEKNVICIFRVLLHNVLCTTSEMLTMFILQMFTSMLPSDIFVGEAYRFPVTIMYIIILSGVCFFLPTILTKKTLYSKFQIVFVTITMLLAILVSQGFVIIMNQVEQTHPKILDIMLIINLIFLCTFMFLLVFIYRLATSQQEKEELIAKNKLLELEESQYTNLLSTTESLREIKHDIHHHLATIQALVQQNEPQRLAEYLDEYQTHFDLDYSASSTGNLVIDSILSNKLYFAKQQKTRLEYKIHLPERFPFTDVELTALLGNLFDNALEANKKVPANLERWINFQLKPQENMLLIHMSNTFDGIVKKTAKQGFLTRKEEPDHGVGLKRVQTLVQEANGFTEIRYEANIFTVQIIVPLEN